MEEEEGQLNNDDASKAASDEAESPEQATVNANVDDTSATAGTARSYECIFCKRGFSTAQALGGHMNIHRRDRTRVAKSSQAASASSKRPEDASEANYGYYHPYPVHMRSSFNPPKSSAAASGGSLPSEYSTSSMYGNRYARSCTGDDPRRARELSLFGEELHLGLGLGLGLLHGDGGDGKGVGGGEEEEEDKEELDLELRLGH